MSDIIRVTSLTTFTERRKGMYVLVLQLREPTRITIGRLGAFDFAAGYYAYVGSAMGAGGLAGRLKHHLAPVRKPHWHIDYLRQVASLIEIWSTASETVYEHAWADRLRQMPGSALPAARFGASDCDCPAHLIYFVHRPELADFQP